jgi:leader peptidase (prepilin peptidase)/N-methyltransferase
LIVICILYIGIKIGGVIYESCCIKIVSAVSLIFLFYKFSFSVQFFMFSFYAFSLISVSVVDYFYRRIPVIAPRLLFFAGLLFSFFNPVLSGSLLLKFFNSISGSLAGGSVLLLAGLIGELFYKKEVMGGGDIKLMAGIGTFLGFRRVLTAVVAALFIAGIAGFMLILFKKKPKGTYIPFGPFLSLASFAVIFVPMEVDLFALFFAWETRILGM